MKNELILSVNGRAQKVFADPEMPLLYLLRNELGLNNPHFGCGLGQCGSCTVLMDGVPVRSCITPASAAENVEVTTLEGLISNGKLHPVQDAYIQEQVPQCGYCINGWILTAVAFLRENSDPTELQIREALSGLKCRCGTHMAILRAVKRAAQQIALGRHRE